MLQCGLVPDVTKLVCLTDLKGGSADQTLSVVARKSVGGGTDLTDSNFTSLRISSSSRAGLAESRVEVVITL